MQYVIKCGANYIGCDSNGKYIECKGIANATRGPMHKMQNVVNNCIAPNKRGKCKVVEYSQSFITPVVKVHTSASPTSRFDSIVKQIKGIENIDKVVVIDQSPIGRTPRSNPATL